MKSITIALALALSASPAFAKDIAWLPDGDGKQAKIVQTDEACEFQAGGDMYRAWGEVTTKFGKTIHREGCWQEQTAVLNPQSKESVQIIVFSFDNGYQMIVGKFQMLEVKDGRVPGSK